MEPPAASKILNNDKAIEDLPAPVRPTMPTYKILHIYLHYNFTNAFISENFECVNHCDNTQHHTHRTHDVVAMLTPLTLCAGSRPWTISLMIVWIDLCKWTTFQKEE